MFGCSVIKQKGFTLLKIVVSTPLQFSASDKGGFFVSAIKNTIRVVDMDYNKHKVTRKFHLKPFNNNHHDESKLTCN